VSEAVAAATFEPLVGSTFQVVGPWEADVEQRSADDPGSAAEGSPDVADVAVGGLPELTLISVDLLDYAGPFEQFRLVFTGPISAPLDQGTFVLEPAPGGLDGLFLVPNAEREGERVYSASLSVRRLPTESVAP